MKGKYVRTEEQKQRLRELRLGMTWSPEERAKRAAKNYGKGWKQTEEAKARIAAWHRGRPMDPMVTAKAAMTLKAKNPLEKRFWSRVEITEGCWLWMGWRDDDGYGFIWVNGRNERAHRVALRLILGKEIDAENVCHTCDNPPCVRPDHLYEGTVLSNARDREQRGRGRWNGTRNH
jgi:hypothetical protein